MGQIESIFKLRVEDQPAKFPMTDKEILDWMNEYLMGLEYKSPTPTHNEQFILTFVDQVTKGATIRQAVCDAKAYADEVNS